MTAAKLEQQPLAMKTILIVDDHPVFRRGLAALIQFEPELCVCGEAANDRAALDAIRKQLPDLVIVDLTLEGSDGLDLVKKIKTHHPKIPALVVSMHDEAVYAERSLRAGARGYVNKQQLDETVLAAIRCVLNGGTYMSDDLKTRLATKFIAGETLDSDSPLTRLSDRELQVFRLIGQGKTTRQIAEALHLSPKTIESHREHIKDKLSVQSAAELTQHAVQWVETDLAG